MVRCHFLQDIRSRRIARLCLLSSRKLHFLKEDRSELLRAVQIELFFRFRIDFLRQFTDPHGEHLPILNKRLAAGQNAFLLHLCQDTGKRHLHTSEEVCHIFTVQFTEDRILRISGGKCCIPGAERKIL